MLLKEAKEILKKNGYRLVEDTGDYDFISDPKLNSYLNRVMNCLIDEYDYAEDEAIHVCMVNKRSIIEDFEEGLAPYQSAHIQYVDRKYYQ